MFCFLSRADTFTLLRGEEGSEIFTVRILPLRAARAMTRRLRLFSLSFFLFFFRFSKKPSNCCSFVFFFLFLPIVCGCTGKFFTWEDFSKGEEDIFGWSAADRVFFFFQSICWLIFQLSHPPDRRDKFSLFFVRRSKHPKLAKSLI